MWPSPKTLCQGLQSQHSSGPQMLFEVGQWWLR